MPANLRDLDLRTVFASLRFTADLPLEIFVRRATRRLPDLLVPPAPVAEPELPSPGCMIGGYRLEHAIGQGGLGAVYRARHVARDEIVAIKLLRPSVVRARPEIPRLLADEVQCAARIDHPNLVRLHELATTDDHTYVVMEHVDGPDLATLVERKGALPCKLVVRMLRHVTAALAAGLAEYLIHQAIKPSSILLTRAGITKLADLGFARSSTGDADGAATFLAPEQASDPQRADFRSDIYALGLTAYHALTGRLPPDGPDGLQRDRDRAPSQFALVPAALDELIIAATAPRPRDRPASYAAIEAALRASR
jgi:serine/threonine-protein kinase